ncbi:MAG: mycofactocin biosynthesis peptidyl-dipeptidase MftE [Solirubrobacterales bacterium]|nr:mycofactocin biosynthesis peptidyl-dipeptidase MftE [Solirubrobacterales bacterium]
MRLGSSTWAELDRAALRRLLIPLGATEQHGPHLPLETDTIIAAAIADAAAARHDDVAVAPGLPYGASGEHAGFPGTLSLGQSALEEAVVELVHSAAQFEAVVLVAWHGGNAEPLARAVDRLRRDGRRVSGWQPSVDGGDAHAGRVETSLMLAIAPELVGRERPVGATLPLARLLPALREHGVRAVSANGVLGDARRASREEGRMLLAALTADLDALLDGSPAAVPAR